ncbi:MAG: hypothetical protein ACXWWU_04560 [Candidatus Limnocylindria bacterium]
MARRGGKAANRRDRNRRAQRKAPLRPAVPQRPTAGAISDAVDAAAERRADAAPARPIPANPNPTPTRGARSDPRFAVAGPSRLSERAASEYHYVLRDLRNIGVLVVVMGVALAAAAIGFSALGIGPKSGPAALQEIHCIRDRRWLHSSLPPPRPARQ